MGEWQPIKMPRLTEEEAEYLRKLQEASEKYDRTKVIGPPPAAQRDMQEAEG